MEWVERGHTVAEQLSTWRHRDSISMIEWNKWMDIDAPSSLADMRDAIEQRWANVPLCMRVVAFVDSVFDRRIVDIPKGTSMAHAMEQVDAEFGKNYTKCRFNSVRRHGRDFIVYILLSV
jgi:hypothetical protein